MRQQAPAVPPPRLSLRGSQIPLASGNDLGGSQRSTVSRHQVVPGPAQWGSSDTPRLLLADDERQVIVMADLGTHLPLATALLGDDPGWIRTGASVRHLAYVAAYALEPLSTWWCFYTPPTNLLAAMLEAFTRSAAVGIPGVDEDPN